MNNIILILFILLLIYHMHYNQSNFNDYTDILRRFYKNLRGTRKIDTTTAQKYTCSQINGNTNFNMKRVYCNAHPKCLWKCDKLKPSEHHLDRDSDGNYRKCCVDKAEPKSATKNKYNKRTGLKGATKELCDKYSNDINKFNIQIDKHKKAISQLEGVKNISKNNCKLYRDCKLDGDDCSFVKK